MAIPVTLFPLRKIYKLDKVDSTNLYAINLLKQNPPAEGSVVWALEQFAGRGRRGSSWLAQPGANLTFSVILHPRFLPAGEQFWLTKVMALAAAQFVSSSLYSFSYKVSVKWPNDIYVNNLKIAGILIENVLEQSAIKHSVAGIGININQEIFDTSLPNATSLKLLTGSAFEPEDCLNRVIISIEKYYSELQNSNYSYLDAAYNKLLYRRNVMSNLFIDGKSCKGIIKGVSSSGQLQVDTCKEGVETGQTLEISDINRIIFL